MKSSKQFLASVVIISFATAAFAAHVDMKDPRRALGRDDDIRIDAELMQDQVGTNSPISVTYQIENLTNAPVAIADKLSMASYDPDTRTIVVSIGSEIPTTKTIPHLTLINPGEKRVLTAGTSVHVSMARGPFSAVPEFVKIEVNVLRDVRPFAQAITLQAKNNLAAVPLGNDLFDQWVQSNDSIYLNSIPIRWKGETRDITTAEAQAPAGLF
jgi:hypothetical protein